MPNSPKLPNFKGTSLVVTQIDIGGSFGELGIMNDAKRETSIEAKEEICLA
jgi:hypothetical protein